MEKTEEQDQQSKREESKDTMQEHGEKSEQAEPSVGQSSKTTSKMCPSSAGTSSNADTTTTTVQEQNLTGKTVPSAGTNTKLDSMVRAGTSQEESQTHTPASVAIAEISEILEDKNGTVTAQSPTSVQDEQSKREELQDPIQEHGKKSEQVEPPIGQSSKTTSTSKMFPSSAGTSSNADTTTTSTVQEQNLTGKTVPSAGTNAKDSDLTAGTSQEESSNINVPIIAPTTTISQGTEVLCSMAVFGNKNFLFTGSDNGAVRIWDSQREYARHASSFQSTSGPVNAIAILKFENPVDYAWRYTIAAFVADNGGIRVFLSFSPEYEFGQSAYLQKTMWDPLKILIPTFEEARDKAITCLCFTDKLEFIYSGSMDGTVDMWGVKTSYRILRDTIRSHGGPIHALAVGEEVMFSGSSNGVISMWKRKYEERRTKIKWSHVLIRTLYVTNGTTCAAINAIVFCTIDDVTGLLYAGSSDGNVRCWRTLSLDKADEAFKDTPEVMSYHDRAVNCLALCSGPFVFSGSADNKICVWRRDNEGKNHTPVMILEGHSDVVTCITVEEDEKVLNKDDTEPPPRQWILYSGSLDKTLRIWRVHDHQRSTTSVRILPELRWRGPTPIY